MGAGGRSRNKGSGRIRYCLAAHALFFLLLVAGAGQGGGSAAGESGVVLGPPHVAGERQPGATGQDPGSVEEGHDVLVKDQEQERALQLARAEEALERVFGHSKLRGQQANVILELLGGRDAFGVMPTGAGKSICYQVREPTFKETSEFTKLKPIERMRRVCPCHRPPQLCPTQDQPVRIQRPRFCSPAESTALHDRAAPSHSGREQGGCRGLAASRAYEQPGVHCRCRRLCLWPYT